MRKKKKGNVNCRLKTSRKDGGSEYLWKSARAIDE